MNITNKTILTVTAAFLIAFGLFITWAILVTPTTEEAHAKSLARIEQRAAAQNERIDCIVSSLESNKVATVERERITAAAEKEKITKAIKMVELTDYSIRHDYNSGITTFTLEVKNASYYNFYVIRIVLTMYDKHKKILNSYPIVLERFIPAKSRTEPRYEIDWKKFRGRDFDGVPFGGGEVESYTVGRLTVIE